MSFREITMQDVSAVLRRWQAGQSSRRIAREMGLDRKIVGRYIDEARAGGIVAESAVMEEVARAIGKGVQARAAAAVAGVASVGRARRADQHLAWRRAAAAPAL
jgi:predicted transcriptional regulator